MRKKIGIFKIFSKASGGNIYKEHVLSALSGSFNADYVDLEAKGIKNRYLRALASLSKMFFFKGEKNLWIRDFYSTTALNKKNTKGKNLSLIFHIDFSGFRLVPRIVLPIIEKAFFYRQLKKVDAIVVISEFWKNYFLKRGYKNVYKIYCGFDLEKFNITDQEVKNFKKKYRLEGKPIIYLGNCQKPKGVIDSYKALKGLDVHFLTSGKREVKLPTVNLDLDYRGYLTMLKASQIVITMSKFKEGWNMTAHEAMLLKIPVIGSGLGGMKELLDGGKQIICTDFINLRNKVQYLLENIKEGEEIGQKGYEFAKNFTSERFKQEWLKLADRVL